MIRGGAGSGKSYSMAQYLCIRLLIQKEKWLIVRKVSSTLKDSCIALIKEILEDMQLSYKYNKVDKEITLSNGSVILFKGMDDPEKIKSITGINHIWIEEITELESLDLDQLSFRLRGVGNENAQIFGTFNPISEQHWIKKQYYDVERDDVDYHFSTFKDNKFIGENYAEKVEIYRKTNKMYYDIYVLGQWGSIATGMELYNNFDVEKHVNECCYNDNLPIWLSFDENYLPYCAVIVSQIYDNKINVIDEFGLVGKNLKDVCSAINNKYNLHNNIVYITGDAAGKNRTARGERDQNMFTLINNYLNFKIKKMMVNAVNENVVSRVLWINYLFDTQSIKININKKCEKLIYDLQNVQTSADGGKQKKRGKLESGEVCELLGHFSDVFDYQMCTAFNKEYKLFKNKGIKNPFIGIGRTY